MRDESEHGPEQAQSNSVVCLSCGYCGGIDTYHASMSMWSDCRCPKCGSTNNEHNSQYAANLFKALKDIPK